MSAVKVLSEVIGIPEYRITADDKGEWVTKSGAIKAMESYATHCLQQEKKGDGKVCDFCLDTYRVQIHEVCERCRKLCGD